MYLYYVFFKALCFCVIYTLTKAIPVKSKPIKHNNANPNST